MLYKILTFIIIAAISIFPDKPLLDSVNTQLYGNIKITSNPDNADIFLNGEKTFFKTPALIKNLTAGLNTLEISMPNYLFAKRQINIIPDTTLHFSFNLLSLSDTAHILGDLKLGILRLPPSPINTPYLIDNKQIYSSEITLNTGKHNIVWEGGNLYSSLDTIVDIFSGKLTTFNFIPERLTGEISIKPMPTDADILINNHHYSTGKIKIKLSTGVYNLTIKRNGYFPLSEQITISPKKSKKIRPHLNSIPDKDNDGFLDSIDLCPKVYGLYGGCPKQNKKAEFTKYKITLLKNLREQPLTFSFATINYSYRRPTSRSFSQLVSYFNDGSLFFNNQNGFSLANKYTLTYHGFIVSCELAQWYSRLEYKKLGDNVVNIETKKSDYLVYYKDTSTHLNPSIKLPGTTLSAGFNVQIKKFNTAYIFGYRWENIIITDLITKPDYESYTDALNISQYPFPYTGEKTNVIFNNSHWFHGIRMEYDILPLNKTVISLYITATASFNRYLKTGWNSFQTGFLWKFYPLRKKSKKETENDKENL